MSNKNINPALKKWAKALMVVWFFICLIALTASVGTGNAENISIRLVAFAVAAGGVYVEFRGYLASKSGSQFFIGIAAGLLFVNVVYYFFAR